MTQSSPQHIIEGIILRRLHEKRIEGYTIEMAKEIAEALHGAAQPRREPALVGLLTEVDPGLADALRENGGYVQVIRGNVLREATQLSIGAVSKVVSSRDDLGNVHFVLLSDAIIAALALSSTHGDSPVGWGGHLPGKIEP